MWGPEALQCHWPRGLNPFQGEHLQRRALKFLAKTELYQQAHANARLLTQTHNCMALSIMEDTYLQISILLKSERHLLNAICKVLAGNGAP